MADSVIGKDAAGYEVLTAAIKELLNQFPGLEDGEEILYENLGEDSGLAFSADNGALIYSERKYVSGLRYQKCKYPFYVVYRTAATREKQKINVQTFLDALGKWICREPAVVNDETVTLARWPTLAQGREIIEITRDNSYALEPQENGVQDWLLPVSVSYTNTYKPS